MLDLRGAYNLVRIADGNEWKTAFRTLYGSYESHVMHCGLTNAPAPFQRFMSEVFKDILDVCVLVYLDDILIYFDNPGEHLKHVREVSRRLRASNLYAKVEKCAFSVDTTDYLGFVIGPDSLRMDTPRIQVILGCPAPEKVRTSNRSWVSQTFTDCLSPRTPISRPTDSAYAQGRPVGLVSTM